MIEIKPYKINKTIPYYSFDVKGRGTVFCFYIDENKHLLNIDLIGQEVVINGDIWCVKELEKVIIEYGDRNAYSVIVDKINVKKWYEPNYQKLCSDFEKRKMKEVKEYFQKGGGE